ncbi:unnamed protein product [Rhodiola kirilowii]
MKWRTKDNDNDCGIFTMRHMETYMGGGEKKWTCGLSIEGVKQDGQLCAPRDIYMNLIIRSSLNNNRDKVLQRANEWLRNNPNEYCKGNTSKSTYC